MKRNKKCKKLIFIFLLMFFNYCENANREKENRNVEEAIFPLISCTDRMECQDGIWCNGIEYCGCFGGICGRCLPGYPQNCDDGNPCTVDNCINDYIGKAGRTGVPGEFGTGHCEHRQICQYCIIDSDCFDNDKCTDDLCVENICQNTPKNCNDNDFCTIDSCDDSTGDCVHQKIPDCCHTDADCNDGYECTVDRCNTAIHICSHTANVGANCSYPDECFDPGICMSDGLCHPGAQRVPSNDTCSGALPVTISDIGEGCVEGTTLCARHDYSSSCGGGGSPDVMYSFSFEVGNAFQLYAYNIILDADYNSVLYAQSSCGVSSTMITCNDNCVSSTLLDCTAYNLGRYDSAIVLPPYPVGSRKTIYLGVDGMAGSKGDFKLQIHRVNHRNNPCWYASDTPRRVDATQGGEYRGNINGYINDIMVSETWNYERDINLTPSTPVNGYQVMIVLTPATFNYSRVSADGRDIRFYDTAGNKLSYWIEQWNPAGTSIIWVRVISSGANRIIMKYGNGSAVSESNGYGTFDFFDDFEGSTLNSSRWNTSGHSGYPGILYQVNSGRLEVWSDNQWRILNANRTISSGVTAIVESRLQETPGTSSWHAHYLVRNTNANNQRLGVYHNGSVWQVQLNINGSYSYPANLGNIVTGSWVKMQIKKKSSTNLEIARLRDDNRNVEARYETNQSAWSGIDWMFVTWKYYNTRSYFDWVLERKYAANEPVATIGAERASGTTYNWMKTPCHKVTSGAGSDWPGNAWFVLNPASTTTYCVWTDETAPAVWADTVITLIDNTVPSGGGCGGLKRYLGCAHLNGQNGPANPTKMQITVPGGSTYMIGISSFDRPSSGNYRVRFDLGACP